MAVTVVCASGGSGPRLDRADWLFCIIHPDVIHRGVSQPNASTPAAPAAHRRTEPGARARARSLLPARGRLPHESPQAEGADPEVLYDQAHKRLLDYDYNNAIKI